jgi:hypothetical protein
MYFSPWSRVKAAPVAILRFYFELLPPHLGKSVQSIQNKKDKSGLLVEHLP